jgi:hypothetical protein
LACESTGTAGFAGLRRHWLDGGRQDELPEPHPAEDVAGAVAALVIVTTVVGGAASEVTSWVYRVAVSLLVAVAVVTALTGARMKVIWFKICPVLLTSSTVLLLVASLV